MDLMKMIATLRQEHERVGEVIIAMERLALGSRKHRGRPPAWMTAAKRQGRPPGSKNKPREPNQITGG
jgi:hypothetical protein